MALSDIASKYAGTGVPHQTCATCHALSTMTDSEAAELRRLLADTTVRYQNLAADMAADPDVPTVDYQSLSRHARGLCSARENLRSVKR